MTKDFNVNDSFDFEERIISTSYSSDSTYTTKKFLIADIGFSDNIEKKLRDCINYSKATHISPNLLLIGCPQKYVLKILEAITNELNVPSKVVDWRTYRNNFKEGDFAAILTKAKEEDIICFSHIDNAKVEFLHIFEQAVLSNSITITLGKGNSAKTFNLDLARFGTILAVENINHVPKDILGIFHEIIDFKKYDYELRLISISDFAERYFLNFEHSVKERLAKQFTNAEQLQIQLTNLRAKAFELNTFDISESLLQDILEPLPELDKIDQMNGREFEVFTAQLLSGNGFENIRVTQASYDYGVDVIAEKDDIKYAIQCKRYNGPIGVSAVQEVIASKSINDCHVACVLTNSTYTPAAIELAKKNLVILWDRTKLQKFIDKANT